MILAVAIATLGAVTCIASDFVFGRSDPYGTTIGVGWDLVVAAPFGLLSLLVLVTGLSVVTALVTAGALTLLAVFSYHAANTDSSSTAGIAIAAPWTAGIPLVIVAWIVDRAVRAGIAWRDWHRDERRA